MADHRANVTQYAHRLKTDSVHTYSLAMVPFLSMEYMKP